MPFCSSTTVCVPRTVSTVGAVPAAPTATAVNATAVTMITSPPSLFIAATSSFGRDPPPRRAQTFRDVPVGRLESR